jgi:predicted nuclease with RNAse H fold
MASPDARATGAAVTVGIDVASQPAGTAACHVHWEQGGATVISVEHDVDDSRLAALLVAPVARIGLDVPLGWPDRFVEAVGRHHAGRPFGASPAARLARRETDRWVQESIHQLPLSVSTDRIAYPAMRVARVLGELAGAAVDRSGTGRIVEVYPAAALRQWGLPHRGYKGRAGRPALTALLDSLRQRSPWLTAGAATWSETTRTDHSFDALVCALVARARQLDLCHAIPDGMQDAAAREGWIAVPLSGSLERLPSEGAPDLAAG